jgi:hypothetical protein
MPADVYIEEVASSVRTMDGGSLLAPKTLAMIIAAVMQAVRDHEAHEKRRLGETTIGGSAGGGEP